MLDLTTPTDHSGAYEWASVLLAHGFIGAVAWALVAWLLVRAKADFDPYLSAMQFVVFGYFLLWEGLVQKIGAGIIDALVDSAAVTVGALLIWGAWTRRTQIAGVAVALLSVVALVGIWRRK